MSEKSAPAEGVEGATEDLTGEAKQTLGAVGVHGETSTPGHPKPSDGEEPTDG